MKGRCKACELFPLDLWEGLCVVCRSELEGHHRVRAEVLRDREAEVWELERWQDAMANEGFL